MNPVRKKQVLSDLSTKLFFSGHLTQAVHMAPLAVRKKHCCDFLGKHTPSADKATLCPYGYDHPGGVCMNITQICTAFNEGGKHNVGFLKKYKLDLEYAQRLVTWAQECGSQELDALPGELFAIQPILQQQGEINVSLAPYFEILGIPPTASAAEIKRAYRMGRIRTHPDKNSGDDAEYHTIENAFNMCNGQQSEPDAQDRLGAKVMIKQKDLYLIPFHSEKFDGHDALLFAYLDLLGVMDPGGNIDVELYGNSDIFTHPKKTEWLAHLILTVGSFRFDPLKRPAGLAFGAPLSAAEIKRFQPLAYKPGGVVSIFMNWDPDAASANLQKRNLSTGWQGLCSLFGHDINTDVFQFWIDGFRRTTASNKKRKMDGEMDPEFNPSQFQKFAETEIGRHEVWAGVNTNGKSWDIAFAELNVRAQTLLAQGAPVLI